MATLILENGADIRYISSSSGTSIYAYDERGNLSEETNATGAVVARYSQGLNIDEETTAMRLKSAFLCLMIFCAVAAIQAVAAPNDPCDLPPDLQAELSTKLSGCMRRQLGGLDSGRQAAVSKGPRQTMPWSCPS
jgi:YD repeat-containing protein